MYFTELQRIAAESAVNHPLLRACGEPWLLTWSTNKAHPCKSLGRKAPTSPRRIAARMPLA
jgi:hypothetical protein